MRRTSPKRVAVSSHKKRVNKATLYSKQSKKYIPKEDEVFARGRRVPSYTLEEANQLGLASRKQLAEKTGRSIAGIDAWMHRHGVVPVARITQPRYGPQYSHTELLYDVSEFVETWKKHPMKPIKKEQEDAH